ncbi:hypothetical protein SCHPADRAFT_167197 [Schizopora paradoxa]|uniref:Uncharacterized protein n=1 Tax=Schizopora paradoxa TaxID=27342 RepID=A0A0H2S065_9AGAM|nr:hypothetical protein SCHPADRAFT_167197 [Schizopora paradoxa]
MANGLDSEKAIITDLVSKSTVSRSRLPLATSRIYNSAKTERPRMSLSKLPSSKLQENRAPEAVCPSTRERRMTQSNELPKPGFAVQRSKSMVEHRLNTRTLGQRAYTNSNLSRRSSTQSTPKSLTTEHGLGIRNSNPAAKFGYVHDKKEHRNSLPPLGNRGITPWPKKRSKRRTRSPLIPEELRLESESDFPAMNNLGPHVPMTTPVKKGTPCRSRTDCLKLEALLSVPSEDLFPGPKTMSLGPLPSQVLQHTPPKHEELMTALGLSPTPPAKKRTLWTMLDEIRLVRSDGLLSGADALEPLENARVVPLYQRRRNGVVASDSPLARRWTCLGTPAKSEKSVAVDSPNFVLSHECLSGDGSSSITIAADPGFSAQEKAISAGYEWSLISMKRKTSGDDSTPIDSSKRLKVTQPSLLARAHTFVRFIGSKKSSGRS